MPQNGALRVIIGVNDVDRRLYVLLGSERGTRRQVWSLGTLKIYVRLLRDGRHLARLTEDINQLCPPIQMPALR